MLIRRAGVGRWYVPCSCASWIFPRQRGPEVECHGKNDKSIKFADVHIRLRALDPGSGAGPVGAGQGVDGADRRLS